MYDSLFLNVFQLCYRCIFKCLLLLFADFFRVAMDRIINYTNGAVDSTLEGATVLTPSQGFDLLKIGSKEALTATPTERQNIYLIFDNNNYYCDKLR